ncbi:MAG: hypothetical protein Salg2KO_18830 [Salibacteraceae bacterium]
MDGLSTREKWILLGLGLVAILAHLLNLGLMPIMADECIRATVAWEMMVSENYIVPTIWGEYYYRKPPLYNWIIIGFFKAFNSYSEFVFRLPSVIPLFLLSLSTWYVSRKHIGDRAGAIAAFGFLLSGRLLTRDSMLGHIDLAFSLITFIGFFVIYHFQKRKRYWLLFVLSYLLAALGVLMKGLPSFLFQGLTLVAWLVYARDWKKLFSTQHFAGLAVFVAIVGGYFWLYSQYNSLETYFDELYGQAAMRTVVDKPWYEGVINLFTFPFENFGHLFPTSLLIIFAFRKGTLKRWLRNDFLVFTMLTLVINIIPYWLSPGYYPRYLFMLYPLIFLLAAESFVVGYRTQKWPTLVFDILFGIMGFAVFIGFNAVYFVPTILELHYSVWTSVLLTMIAGVSLVLWYKYKEYRIYLSFGFIILFRIGFDLYVIPYRMAEENNKPTTRKHMSEMILAHAIEDMPIKVFGKSPMYREHAFYLGVATNQIIERSNKIIPGNQYLITGSRYEKYKAKLTSLHSHRMEYKDYVIHLCEAHEMPATTEGKP